MNKITKYVVDFALFLDESNKYKKFKDTVKRVLEDQSYRYNKYFNYVMIFLIISSVAILIDEVKHPIEHWLVFYDVYIVTTVFLVEYILRLWVYNDNHKIVLEEFQDSLFLEKKFNLFGVIKKIILKKIEYITSPLAIIDILAILPSFRELRILRIFVLFRAFKLLRYSHHLTYFLKVFVSKKSELLMVILIFIFVIFLSGVSIYVFEEKTNPHINTIYDAFYWALITITSVGYGDIVPLSSEGRSIASIIVLIGIALVAFATSVLVSAFNEESEELKIQKTKSRIEKFSSFYLLCGYSHLCELLSLKLKNNNDNFVIVDTDIQKVNAARKEGYIAIVADASSKSVLLDLQVTSKVLAVIALAQDDIQNIFIALNVRSISKNIMIISRMRNKNSYKKLKLAGVDKIISASNTASMLVPTLVDKPLATEAINSILSGKRHARCEQIEIGHDSQMIGKSLKSLNLGYFKLILLGISRIAESKREFIFNPDEETILQEGDILVVLGYSISISNFKNLMEKRSIKYARKK